MKTPSEILVDDRAQGAEVQTIVTAGVRGLATLRELAEARVDVETFPQYRGAWDDCELYQVARKVTTKAGVAFLRFDVTLGRVQTGDEYEGAPKGLMLFSFRNGVDTLVGAKGATLFA